MKPLLKTVVLLLLLLPAFLAGCKTPPESIMIRLSDSSWLQINQDGSGAYGYGVLPESVPFENETFVFEDVIRTLKKKPSTPPGSLEIMVAVSSRQDHRDTYELQTITAVQFDFISSLFTSAYVNAKHPANTHTEQIYARMNRFIAGNNLIQPEYMDSRQPN